MRPGAAEASPTSAALAPVRTGQERQTTALPWTVLASPIGHRRSRKDDPVNVRRIVLQVVAAAAAVICMVGIAGAAVSKRVAERQSVHDAAEITDVLAESVIQPALTDAMVQKPAESTRILDPIVRKGVLTSSLIRVKLWSPTGQVLYSDESRLIGRTFALDDEAQTSLTAPRTVAGVSDLRRPENAYERSLGRLLEVYRPVWTQSGQPVLLETYFRYDNVTARSRDLWRGFSGIMVSSLIAVFILLLPLIWALLHRTRRAQRQREAMMQRAVDASDDERKRIAGTLHDGVVQDLVAASFAVAAEAGRASASGERLVADRMESAADTVRSSIAGLRALLVDIYPSSLCNGGLQAALADLVGTLTARDAHVTLEIDDAVIGRMSPEVQQAVFQVSQECLRNAARHAHARRISVTIAQDGDEARLDVIDDGVGFELASTAGAVQGGHLGLQLMVDVAERAGASLAVATGPGAGTHTMMKVRL
jgi:signal transduction histidine kinase